MQTQEPDTSPENGETSVVHDYPNGTRYTLEDFSQQAINRGQQRINYELNAVDRSIAEALKALKDAIAATPAGDRLNFDAFNTALSEVEETTKKIPGIFPPGCKG